MSIFDKLANSTRETAKPGPGEETLGSGESLRKFRENIFARLGQLRYRLKHMELSRQAVSKGEQILLTLRYRELAEKGTMLDFEEVGFQNFSQFEEDGILHYIFSLIGFRPARAVEFCAGVGSQSMSANLIIDHGWSALLVDGDEKNVTNGINFFSRHPSTRTIGPVYQCHWIDCESVNAILREAGFVGEIGLLTLDLDGVDYWIWDAITEISPRVVVVEFSNVYPDRAITVPYDPEFKAQWIPLFGDTVQESGIPGQIGLACSWVLYGGASLPAFVKLGKAKGYRLIGVNRSLTNAFFLRDDVGREFFSEVSCESCLSGKKSEEFLALGQEKLAGFDWQEV